MRGLSYNLKIPDFGFTAEIAESFGAWRGILAKGFPQQNQKACRYHSVIV